MAGNVSRRRPGASRRLVAGDARRAVLQIVPALGGAMDGVADYAGVLAAALEKREGLASEFVAGASLPSRSSDALMEALSRKGHDAVLLHYVNYGYEARGCPVWLIEGLKAWRRAHAHARLVTMFHEIYAWGPPWRSSFWLSPIQRRLARHLCRLSDAAVTNRERSAAWLRHSLRGERRERVVEMPVFSTLGEPADPGGWDARANTLVVAGRSGERGRAYTKRREQLMIACRTLGIEQIVDIGHRAQLPPRSLDGIPIEALGHVDARRASAVLATARAGFIDYPSDFIAKSTVFAAYAAHRAVPVVAWRRGHEEAGLEEGANYWVPRDESPRRDFESISGAAFDWYRSHRSTVQADHFARVLRG